MRIILETLMSSLSAFGNMIVFIFLVRKPRQALLSFLNSDNWVQRDTGLTYTFAVT